MIAFALCHLPRIRVSLRLDRLASVSICLVLALAITGISGRHEDTGYLDE